MKLTIKTQTLKEMLSKSSVGSGKNKLIPITNLMCISAKGKEAKFITTDATNYLYVFGECAECEDEFYGTIYAEQFERLVPKLNTETTELCINNGTLEVHAKGTYTMELPLDTDGTFIQYPDPIAEVEKIGRDGEVKAETIKLVEKTIKDAIADTLERPILTYYYAGDTVIGSNGCIVSEYSEPIFEDKKALLSSRLMTLLCTMNGSIAYTLTDDYMIFSDSNSMIYANVADSADDYYIDKTTSLLATEFEHEIKISKDELLSTLDRISIFIEKADNEALALTFTNDELVVSNVKAHSTESVAYKENTPIDEYNCYVNVAMLVEQLRAYTGDVVTIRFGGEVNAIELYSEQTKHFIALMVQ